MESKHLKPRLPFFHLLTVICPVIVIPCPYFITRGLLGNNGIVEYPLNLFILGVGELVDLHASFYQNSDCCSIKDTSYFIR